MTLEADALKEPLKAVSNVIELDPTKKYLFVFKGDFTMNELAYVQHRLKAQGIESLALALQEGQELEVIVQHPPNPYEGVPQWEEVWKRLYAIGLHTSFSGFRKSIYIFGNVYLGEVDEVAMMSKEAIRAKIKGEQHEREQQS